MFFRPAVDNDSIKKGYLTELNYIWYPYNEKGVELKTEQELKEKTPYFYENYLFPNKQKLISRARKDENSWWFLSEHRAWLRNKYPKLVSTEFGHSGSFAFDKRGEFVVERGNAWIPKKEFKKEDYYYFYLALFNSSFFEELLSIYSKQLAGGKWYDLGKKYSAEIPIPEITTELEQSFVYEKLIEFGKQISNNEFFYFNLIDDYLKEYIYKIEA